MARQYLGKELPRLGASCDDDEPEKPRSRRARDTEDTAAQFEADCRALGLRLQREG